MWEYLVEDLEGDGELQDWLDEMGRRGWELIHYRYIAGNPGLPGVPGNVESLPQHEMILKRPLEGE